MNREEAVEKLIEMLDEQAEHFRRAPRVYYLITEMRVARGTRNFFRFFVVRADGELENVEYLMRRAGNFAMARDHGVPRVGEYSPETGFRLESDGYASTSEKMIREMLACCFDGTDVDVDSIEIRSV